MPAIVLSAGMMTSASAAPVAPGNIGLRLVNAPVGDSNDPRARIYIVEHVAPGTTIDRQIELSNTTAAVVPIVLYPAAATIAGGSFHGADGHAANDVSSWTSVDPSASDVPAGGRVKATVTIAVPGDAPPGEQYGVVWAEARSAPTGAGGVTFVNRVGIRLYVSVGPGGPPAADFTIDSLRAERSPDGTPTVRAMVHNTGGRALDLSGTLQLSDGPGGLGAGPFPTSLGGTLAIGDTEPATIALDEQLPRGPWMAHITLHSGLLERDSRATLSFPAGAASADASSRPGWVSAAIAGLLVLLLGVAVLLIWRRRRSRGPAVS